MGIEIDWFTFFAQVFNFLILLYLLKRFLYGPITKAMKQRQERIVAAIKTAEEKEQKAEAEAKKLDAQRQELADRKAQLLEQAHAQAEKEKKNLIAQAQQQVTKLEGQWRASLDRQKDAFLRDLQRRSGEQVCVVVRKVLQDLAGANLEDQLIRTFLERLSVLPDADRQELQQALGAKQPSGRVRSAFEISEKTRSEITGALQTRLAAPSLAVTFEQEPALISGLEFIAKGYRIGWNLQDYFQELQEDFWEETEEAEAPPEEGAKPGAPADQTSPAKSASPS